MRCWETAEGRLLVENPEIPRQSGRDPLVNSYRILLLEHANQVAEQTGGREALSSFARYYVLGPGGEVLAFYEEAGFADEDCAYNWAYRVLGSRLWKFSLTSSFSFSSEQELHSFSFQIEEEALQPAELPPQFAS